MRATRVYYSHCFEFVSSLINSSIHLLFSLYWHSFMLSLKSVMFICSCIMSCISALCICSLKVTVFHAQAAPNKLTPVGIMKLFEENSLCCKWVQEGGSHLWHFERDVYICGSVLSHVSCSETWWNAEWNSKNRLSVIKMKRKIINWNRFKIICPSEGEGSLKAQVYIQLPSFVCPPSVQFSVFLHMITTSCRGWQKERRPLSRLSLDKLTSGSYFLWTSFALLSLFSTETYMNVRTRCFMSNGGGEVHIRTTPKKLQFPGNMFQPWY